MIVDVVCVYTEWRAGLSVGLAVVGCVVLAIVLLMVVIRWRRRSNSASAANASQPEMEWDNSAFNITVNPIGIEVRIWHR